MQPLFIYKLLAYTDNNKGEIVRFGPNRISVCSAGGSHDLGSVKANVLRSPVFSSFRRFFGVDSSATILNPKEHFFQRRVNNQAMIPGVLQNYADRVTPYLTFMINKFKDSIHAVGKEGSLGGEIRWSPPVDFTREDYSSPATGPRVLCFAML